MIEQPAQLRIGHGVEDHEAQVDRFTIHIDGPGVSPGRAFDSNTVTSCLAAKLHAALSPEMPEPMMPIRMSSVLL